MTLPEVLVVLTPVFLMAFCPVPKTGPKPKKKRKPLAVRGNLRRRALYRRWREPTAEQRAFAEKCRQENLRYDCPAIRAVESELTALGIRYRREEIVFYDGDLFVLVDLWLPNLKIGIEADGQQHRFQRRYDIQKDRMVEEVTGFKICRRWNAWFLRPNLRERMVEILG
jgi:very-short-patch-repair endonuclease